MVIDSHHHFWQYSEKEYGWINDEMASMRRDFLPEHLRAECQAAGVDGVVSVQARQTVEETAWLLDFAEQHDWILGTVGWVPLADSAVGAVLDEFHGRSKLKAVRHVVQDEPDLEFILGSAFNEGISQLKSRGLVYDILIYERQLPPSIEFVDRHPEQLFVLDHLAKPKIAVGEVDPWEANFRELAKRENVYCKLSGIVTEADWQDWTIDTLRPYVDVALEAFSPKRLMFGSDWPPLTLAGNYGDWLKTVQLLTASLSETEQSWLFGKTAQQAYGLAP